MNVGQTDSLLRLFAQTSDADEQDRVLSALLTEHAAPVAAKIIRYKTRGESEDGDDIYSEVMLQLVGRLRQLRAAGNGGAIDDFNAYVAVTTYNACDRFLSRKYPQRRRLKNGLRYLLTHREGFALWQDERQNYVGGFRRWQFGASGDDSSLKIQSLREDARAFAGDVAVQNSWSEQKNAYELLTAIFEWIGAPVEIDLLVNVCAVWWNITDETIEVDAANTNEKGEQRPNKQLADGRPDAYTETERRDYLQRLWNEIAELPARQRAAVLLNLKDENGRGVIDLWLVTGVATVEKIAAVLEMSVEAFVELWNDLPLDDNRIAEKLNLTRQQVINLRKSARERLARRMKGF
jgi:DNA-directed RNA polymerase specialized sigma24 family protein